MFAHIEKVEPESVSLIIGGEVSVEFINDFKEDIIPSAPAPTPVEGSPLIGPMIPSSMLNPVIMPLTRPSSPQISSEDRRRIVRESWVKRCQNNVTRQ